MSEYDWREEINALAADTTSGSQAVCLKAAEVFIKVIDAYPDMGPGVDAGELLAEIGRRIERAKPAMAALYTLTAGIIAAVENAPGEGADAAEAARRAAVEFRGRLLTANDGIAANAMELLGERACVATNSRSGTVKAVLKLAKEKGRLRRVLLSEARPAFEGRLSAEEFARMNITVAFVADAALPGMLDQCDMVLVGGDALCPSGLVGKAGTYPLAMAARRMDRPFAACIGSEKIVPFNIPQHYLREDGGALWEPVKISIQVINRIFEYTPLDLIDHLVTEDGITSGADIPNIFAKMKINPHLPNWL